MNPGSFKDIKNIVESAGATLVAVSKTKTVEEIRALYDLGQRDFGENYVQELMEKEAGLPKDIRWHFIGHLQSNKVKFLAPFIYMIQSVDSLKLLQEIDKHAARNQRVIRCLFQIFIAREETKFGMDESELDNLIHTVHSNREGSRFSHSAISGCMGMASLTEDQTQIRAEFDRLRNLFQKTKTSFPSDPVDTLSMGMSSDYPIAIEAGSNMVRIGSLIFGKR